MLEKILRMANAHLTEILVDSHASLLAKLLAQNAFTARRLITKFIQRKRTFQTGRQPGNQLIQQRFAGCWRQRVTGVTVALQQHNQLTEQQFRQLIGERRVLTAFMLKLANHLSRLRHARTA